MNVYKALVKSANLERIMLKIQNRSGSPRFEMSDEVRELFDRMLATDEQISESRERMPIMLYPEDPGLQEDAEEALTLANDRAREIIMKDQSDKYRSEVNKRRNQIAKEISKQVEQEKIYQVMSRMKGGEMKMNGNELRELLGDNHPAITQLRGLHNKSGENAPIAFVAEHYEYRNAEELLDALMNGSCYKHPYSAIGRRSSGDRVPCYY